MISTLDNYNSHLLVTLIKTTLTFVSYTFPNSQKIISSQKKTKKIETDMKTSYAQLMEEMANVALNSQKIKNFWIYFDYLDLDFSMPFFNLALYSDFLDNSDHIKGLQLYVQTINLKLKIVKKVTLQSSKMANSLISQYH